MIPLVAGVDLNHRPLGYEGNVTTHTNQLPPTKPNKTIENAACELVPVGMVSVAVPAQFPHSPHRVAARLRLAGITNRPR
jgi:hypothetical protein